MSGTIHRLFDGPQLHAPGIVSQADPTIAFGTDPYDPVSRTGGIQPGHLWIETDGGGDVVALHLRNTDNDAWLPVEVAPAPHASTHEDGGSDEIDVTGLSGLLADDQTAIAHDLLGDRHTFPSLVRGDLLASDVNASLARLAIGAANRILLSDGTDPAWAANLPYATLPTGSGTWDVGAGNTLTFTRTANINALRIGGATTPGAIDRLAPNLIGDTGTDIRFRDVEATGEFIGSAFGLTTFPVEVALENQVADGLDEIRDELWEISAGFGDARRVGVNATAYTITNDTPDRTLDPTAYSNADAIDLAHVVATLIRDLGRDS